LLNPFRLFDTVNDPSGCATIFIQQAGLCALAGAPRPAPPPRGGAVNTLAIVAASSTLAM
jgi:hypothetical protein